MRSFGYIRISRQDESPDSQERILLRSGCGIIRSDLPTHNAPPKWEELDMLIDRITAGDSITIVSLQNLALSPKELLSVIDIIRGNGAYLKTADNKIDTTKKSGTFFIDALKVIAESENRRNQERHLARKNTAIERGNSIGRRPISDSLREILYNRLDQGESIYKLAKTLRLSTSTVHKYAKRHRKID